MKLLYPLIFVVGTTLNLVGCAGPYRLSVPAMNYGQHIHIIDRRPEAEKKTAGQRSINIQNCEYGLTDIGENGVVPSRLEILKAGLEADKEVTQLLEGREVSVESFKIIRNWQQPLRKGAPNEGAIQKLLNASSCFAGPNIEGGYSSSENPSGLPSFTIIISLRIGKDSFNIRHFETAPDIDKTIPWKKGNVFPEIMNAAISKVIGELKAKIKKEPDRN